MNIALDIEKHAAETPQNVALVHDGTEISFFELEKNSSRTANGLKSLGITEGDRVAIMLPNTPEFVYSFYACQKIGAVAVPFNTMYKGREISHILQDSGAKAIICLTNFVPLINELLPDLPALEHIITTGERTITFTDQESTVFIQAVVKKSAFPVPDDFYRKIGDSLTSTFQKVGLKECWYSHRGAVRLDGKKLAGFYISEIEDIYIVNALCFLSEFDPSDFFNAVWVPPEVRDKILEPLTSVEEYLGSRPSNDDFCDLFLTVLSENLDIDLKEGALTREEKFGYEKQKNLMAKSSRATSGEQQPKESSGSFFQSIKKLFSR